MTGCGWEWISKGPAGAAASSSSSSSNGSAPAGAFQAAPTKARFYPAPAPRVVREGDTLFVETRVELLDEMDDSTKGIGEFHFELLNQAESDEGAAGLRLYAWDVLIMTLNDQKRYYERTTRSYMFKLKIDTGAAPRRDKTLRLIYTPPGGKAVTAETLLLAG